MSSFRVRPRFDHTLDQPLEAVRRRVLDTFAQHDGLFEVKDFPGFIGLHVKEPERRYWSPRLFLVLEQTGDGKTRVHGTYGPEIEVWSVFLYGYLATGVLGTLGGALGFAQWLVKTEQPWGLWVSAGMATFALLLYLGAQLGQKLGAWQTFQLHHVYQTAVGRPTAVE